MKKMIELTSLQNVEEFLESHTMSFLYVSRQECSVCHAILPKVKDLLNDYPQIHFGYVDANKVGEIAEKFLIFTVPIMLLMIDQKEFIREDRFVRIERLKEKIDQIYDMYNS